jgi:uncharacterized protein YndB with AHSA1/START domain
MSEEPREAAKERSMTFECELPEPPEKVWRALTTPEIVSEWLAPTDLRPEVGAKFAIHDNTVGSDPVECEVLSVEPERSIVFGWRDADARRDGLDSTVTFEIAGTDSGGTHLSIVHEVRYAARSAVAATAMHCATAMAANDNRIELRLAA